MALWVLLGRCEEARVQATLSPSTGTRRSTQWLIPTTNLRLQQSHIHTTKNGNWQYAAVPKVFWYLSFEAKKWRFGIKWDPNRAWPLLFSLNLLHCIRRNGASCRWVVRGWVYTFPQERHAAKCRVVKVPFVMKLSSVQVQKNAGT